MNGHQTIYGLFAQMQSTPQELSLLLDNANAKYNNTFWKTFSVEQDFTESKSFKTIVEATNISVKASLLSAYGQKPLRSFEGGSSYSDSIHKIGHGFVMNQADINAIKELNLSNPDIATKLMRQYKDRTGSMIQGMHSTFNSWEYDALSNYSIKLINQGKTEATVDLRVPSANKLKVMDAGNKGWFDPAYAGSKAQDLLRMDKIADEAGMPTSRVNIIRKSLADKLVLDDSLRKMIVATAGYSQTEDVIVKRNQFLQLLSQTLGIAPFFVIDEKSVIEVNGNIQDDIQSFDHNKIILVPSAKLFKMHRSRPDYADDSNPATVKGFTEGGLFGSLVSYASEPFSMLTNFEAWAFPTFINPNHLVGLDTSVGTATGK